MEITEVRIKLMEGSEDRLRAFCSITFYDSFVVRDLKIIEGNNGPFVAMPSRKLTAHCRQCNAKNHLRARYCNHCGMRLGSDKVGFDQHGRAKLYADIAHPINAECREQIQKRVIEEFFRELELAKQPGYVSRYDEDYDVNSWQAPTLPRAVEDSGEVVDPSEVSTVRDIPAPQERKPERETSRTLQGPHKGRETATEKSDSSRDGKGDAKDEFGQGIFE